MQDYISQRRVAYYQAGGPMPQEQAAQAPQADPQQEIMQLAMQAVQSQDCQAAMQVCQVILQAMQQGGGEEAAPQQEMQMSNGGTLMPAFKKGGFMKGVSKNGIRSEAIGIKKPAVPTRKLAKSPAKAANKNGIK